MHCNQGPLSQSQIGWTLLYRSECHQSERLQGACHRVRLDGRFYTQVRRPQVRPFARSLSQSQIGWTLLHRSEGHQSDRLQGACHRVRLDERFYTQVTSQTVCKVLVTESDWMEAATQVRRPLVRPFARSLSQSQIGWTLLHRSEDLSDRLQGACHRVRLDGRCYTGKKTCQTVCKELVTESDWMDAATQVRRLVRPFARSLSQSQIG
jgi:hypothetical protein